MESSLHRDTFRDSFFSPPNPATYQGIWSFLVESFSCPWSGQQGLSLLICRDCPQSGLLLMLVSGCVALTVQRLGHTQGGMGGAFLASAEVESGEKKREANSGMQQFEQFQC